MAFSSFSRVLLITKSLNDVSGPKIGREEVPHFNVEGGCMWHVKRCCMTDIETGCKLDVEMCGMSYIDNGESFSTAKRGVCI